jgi:hypothetical protein
MDHLNHSGAPRYSYQKKNMIRNLNVFEICLFLSTAIEVNGSNKRVSKMIRSEWTDFGINSPCLYSSHLVIRAI